MTGKENLQLILKGLIPEHPPHFELVFQLEKEAFGMDREAVRQKNSGSEQALSACLEAFDIDLNLNLIDRFGWAAVPATCYEPSVDRHKAIKNLKKAVCNKALVFSFNEKGVYWMPEGKDLMDFVVTMFERPQELHANARKKCEAAKELARRDADAGVDFFIQNTDFGFNRGPFISPKHFREFVTPYMTEIVATIHDLGLPVIMHSDGDLNSILDQIHSTGVDGYQSVDPQAEMDIKSVRLQYPGWILMGNVMTSMLQNCDEQKIRSSVRYCMEHGGIGQRYIFSTSNCIFSGMPLESYLAMIDEYRSMI